MYSNVSKIEDLKYQVPTGPRCVPTVPCYGLFKLHESNDLELHVSMGFEHHHEDRGLSSVALVAGIGGFAVVAYAGIRAAIEIASRRTGEEQS